MGINDDMTESLVGDILNDAATSFFDARRAIEAKIELFQEYVERLHKMAADVLSMAALLNLLLVDDRQAKTFYRMLGLDGDMFLAAKKADPRDLLSDIPFGFGFNSRYKKLVLMVYTKLKENCGVYMKGPPESAQMSPQTDQEYVYYRSIVKMHQLINREIRQINDNISPSCTLQFAKQFKPDLLSKEKITGGGLSNSRSLDEKLCYRPIDLNTLALVEFPALPNPDDVSSSVNRLCKKLCNQYPDELKQIVEFIRHRINTK